MSDARYDVYQHYGTNAERLAFTPDPPALTDVQPIYIWYETDTDETWLYYTTWVQVTGAGLYALADATFLTVDDETLSLINSRQELAGTGITLDDTVAGQRTIKLTDMAQATIKGRAAGAGTGAPTDLSSTQATAILDNFVGDAGAGGTKGLVPAPAAGDAAAGKFLFADGTWDTPTAGTGDVVGPASSTDEAVALFNGTTGKVIKNSVVVVGTTGAVTGITSAGINGSLVAQTKLTVTGQLNIVPSNHSAAGATETIDFAVSNEHTVILDENVTLTLSNPVDGGRYVLIFIQDSSGGNTVTWPATVRWPAGTAPVITSTANKADLVTLYYISSLSIYLGSFNQDYTTT